MRYVLVSGVEADHRGTRPEKDVITYNGRLDRSRA